MNEEKLTQIIHELEKVFPGVQCTGCDALRGFCIYWPTDICPIIATGQHPAKAWKNAYKRIKGKNKKSLERLRKSLLRKEIKKGQYGPGM